MDERPVVIETQDLVKVYGEGEGAVTALGGVSLKIYRGEFAAIMGPSGSGKSTLLNILACLDHATDGKYILNGEDVSNYNREELALIRNRELGFVFQSYNLLPRLTALENVMLPMMYQRENRVSLKDRPEKGMAALTNVGLASRAHHLPSQLSGGQQQRVAIARALINDPILVLADEPTGNLDTKGSVDILELLHQMNGRGHTIVMVTHEPDIAHHTQRIITVRDGLLASDKKNGHPVRKVDAPVTESETDFEESEEDEDTARLE